MKESAPFSHLPRRSEVEPATFGEAAMGLFCAMRSSPPKRSVGGRDFPQRFS